MGAVAVNELEVTLDNISKALGVVCIALIDILSIAMMIRAIMSWFIDEGNGLYNFLISITEPIIIPVRKLLSKTPLGGLPIDISFLITFFLLEIVSTFLGMYF